MVTACFVGEAQKQVSSYTLFNTLFDLKGP